METKEIAAASPAAMTKPEGDLARPLSIEESAAAPTIPVDVRRKIRASAVFLGEPAATELCRVLDALDASEARREQLEVQLAGCGVAALGYSEEQSAKPGDYGWSASYGDVSKLRERVAKLNVVAKAARALHGKDPEWSREMVLSKSSAAFVAAEVALREALAELEKP